VRHRADRQQAEQQGQGQRQAGDLAQVAHLRRRYRGQHDPREPAPQFRQPGGLGPAGAELDQEYVARQPGSAHRVGAGQRHHPAGTEPALLVGDLRGQHHLPGDAQRYRPAGRPGPHRAAHVLMQGTQVSAAERDLVRRPR
jgi:hypothetical protein